MTKKLIPLFVLSLILSVLPSCNSSSIDVEYSYSSSVLVSGFSLTDDEAVLDSLQNVFFSIDLANARIFNADSLPYGTKTSRLIPVITTVSTASAVTLSFPRENMADSVVDYLNNSTDSIDFSLGPVKLTVKSQSGTVERTYEIRVNVHQIKPDTLAWSQIQSAQLPSTFSHISAQRTVGLAGTYYCLTSQDDKYCLAMTNNPANPEWKIKDIELPFTPDVESLRSTEDAIYMLSTDGTLYYTNDFSTWTATDQIWSYIYGAYESELIGCSHQSGSWTINSYPSYKTWNMPEGFPVSGSSIPNYYTLPMGLSPQLVMTGGRAADGSLLSSTWSFDGEIWANITQSPLPIAVEQLAVVDYDLFSVTSSTWAPVQYPALVAIGGLCEEGVNRTVYFSKDWGMTWKKAPALMQFSDEVPVYYGSSAFVYSTIMHTGRATNSVKGWFDLPIKKLYPQCDFLPPSDLQSRVTEAITEWECPAIYMFGGRDLDGQAANTVWRGIILRYTFAPVY